MSSKDFILFYSINFSPELIGIAKYNKEMIDWLINKEYRIKLVTGQPYYPIWKLYESYKNNWSNENLLSKNLQIIRCPLYIPAKPTVLKRLLFNLSFLVSSSFPLFYFCSKKPRLIFLVSPSIVNSILAKLFAKIFNIPLWIHIQDIESDAALDSNLITNKFIYKILYKLENLLFKNANEISTISFAMKSAIEKRISRKSCEVTYFPNWIDHKSYDEIVTNNNSLKKINTYKI
jgi:colanic acid biosynthesis glycosyl transferase WcaI